VGSLPHDYFFALRLASAAHFAALAAHFAALAAHFAALDAHFAAPVAHFAAPPAEARLTESFLTSAIEKVSFFYLRVRVYYGSGRSVVKKTVHRKLCEGLAAGCAFREIARKRGPNTASTFPGARGTSLESITAKVSGLPEVQSHIRGRAEGPFPK
jgi:hypothetical protein